MENVTNNAAMARSAARLNLGPRSFILAVAALYLLDLLVQFLTVPAIPLRWALWPFLLAQVMFIGLWYGIHAARLRDAGRNLSFAQGVAAIHGLAIVLLLLIATFFMEGLAGGASMPRSFLLLRELVTFSRGAGDLLTYLGLIAALALLIAPAFSIWAALLPRRTA